ncbi:lysozyme, putative [Entamoeba invadens IP1]|uniref:lysozyme n=2 Tax=Entamoeba invadens TaxID=33085 RepID=L7FKE7_ENTIV|nr:lysozyme, putative [Entamoeba invadens IP1]BAN40481.1 lysozyme, putative [Entamoeba invadens]ELP84877.1 lysozyme, putative [Entamoeba invadens IP1]BAN40629.1 lysozyme, putative [Entamoeba invadens]BAN40669.1 lysozyme, putative [Entamoeba invadens]BAN40677.1 lysozyme, putative [Entamoeba invadens]|eukprot:XP_004184223.1 lysozyme, putative [Entamoeba invadens IP1]
MFFFACLIAVSLASYGVDVSQPTSASSIQCLRNNGFTGFFICRAWCSPGYFDSNSVYTLQQAQSVGFVSDTSDVYFYPCLSCGNPEGQVVEFWNNVVANNMKFKRVWYDIEGTWTSSVSTNRDFFERMMGKSISYGIASGVYASSYYWGNIFGSYTYSNAGSVPLWYPHYDNWASFGDFGAFGGWSSPYMKQYRGDVSICSAGVDYNYRA